MYYWHVRATNPCGIGGYSATAAFRTAASSTGAFCRSVSLAIPDNNTTGVSDNQTIGAEGVLSDLNVTVQTTHTWVGDLVFAVQNVGTGTSVDDHRPARCAGQRQWLQRQQHQRHA